MKVSKWFLSSILAISLLLGALQGCNATGGQSSSETSSAVNEAGETPVSTLGSEYLDENGFWRGVTALDYVTLFAYDALPIPSDTHTIPDETVQAEIDYMLSYFATSKQVTDRAVQDGDTLNIDYVGSVDGVEFDNGSTGGMGTEVTIGVTQYIDNFLEQLIGHTPGENFDIQVTFPEAYGVEALNGQDAVFNITINYILEAVEQELTDAFVEENLYDFYGYKTADELRTFIHDSLQTNAVQAYVQETIISASTVSSVPDTLMEYLVNDMISYYTDSASTYDMELDAYLEAVVGVASEEELIELYHEYNLETATYYLVIQAIAEDAGINVSDEDISAYFLDYVGVDDYSEYEAQYGMPFIKQAVLCQNVVDYVVENAALV